MSTKKKIYLGIAAAVLVGVLGVSWYGYKEYTRRNKDLSETKADLQISAADLIKTFEANEQQANAKYLDKIIAVTGNVKEVIKDEKGYYTVVLGEEGSMSSVRCSMDSIHQTEAGKLVAGKQVIVKGACTGFNADELLGSDVILNRSVIDKN